MKERQLARLLVATAIAALLLAGVAHAELMGYWPLDGDGAAVVGTDGVLVNGPTATTGRNGAAGGGLAFNGAAQQYVSIAGGGGLEGTANATVSLWVQWNGTQDNGWGNRNGAVTGRQNNGQWSDDVLCIYSGTDPNTSIINWEPRVGQGVNSGVQPGGDWHHVVATMTPGGQVLYVDGVARGTRSSFSGHRSSDPSMPLTLGAWIGDGGSYSTSRMDDVAVWDEAITPGQVAALAAQVVTPQTVATQLVGPVSARASSELAAGSHNRRVGNVVDGVGHTTANPNGWPSDAAGMWLSASGDTTPTITFDLGGVHAIDAAVVHNYNEATAGLMTRGVRQAAISISTDNVTYTPIGVADLDIATGSATGSTVNPAQLLALGGLQARYIRADVLSNYGDGSYTGLNEVEFFGTPLERMPLTGVAVAPSSELHEASFDRRAVHLVDGTGLFADGHTVVPEAAMWLSGGVGFGSAGNDDPDPELVFDLGQTYASLESARIWNYNEAGVYTRRGVNEMEVLVSSDGIDYRSLGVRSLAQAPGVDGVDYSQVLDLNASDVRYVKLDILSNHQPPPYGVPYPPGSATDTAFVGLSEARFYGGEVPAIDHIGARATSELKFRRYAANVVDGVGSATTSPDGWPGEPEGAWLSHGTYRAPNDTAPEIAFDLGGVHRLDSLVLYNYNEPGGFLTRGVQEAEVLVSTDNVNWTSLGNRTFDMASGTGANPGQLMDLGNVDARFVKLDILSNHGDASQFAGLNEVKFFGTPLEQLPIRGITATATSQLTGGSFDRRASHLVDSTGYYADTHSVVPDGHMWLSASNDGAPGLLFDLGDRYSLDVVKIWNYNEMLAGSTRRDLLNRGVSELEILVSMDGVDFDSLGVVGLDLAPGLDDVDFSNQFDLNAWDVQYVRFDILGNYSGAQFPGAGSYTGLSEVQFRGVLIPEPATLTLLAVGGLVALVRRRRRR